MNLTVSCVMVDTFPQNDLRMTCRVRHFGQQWVIYIIPVVGPLVPFLVLFKEILLYYVLQT